METGDLPAEHQTPLWVSPEVTHQCELQVLGPDGAVVDSTMF